MADGENKVDVVTEEVTADVKTDETIVTDKADGGGENKVVTPTWPEDWRKQIAGDDEVELKRLERYAAPADIWKKARELEKKVSSGAHLKPPAKDAPPEQVAAWRKQNDIPETPKDYVKPDGLVIGENDKPLVDAWMNIAHEHNMSNEQVKQSLNWYFTAQEEALQRVQENDAEFKRASEDALRAEFGGEYRMNLNMIGAFVADLPKDVSESLFHARLPSGQKIGDHPEIIKWFAAKARELNPDSAIMPHINGDKGQAIDDEIATLSKEAGDTSKNSPYWHGPFAEKKQARMRELLAVKEKIKSR